MTTPPPSSPRATGRGLIALARVAALIAAAQCLAGCSGQDVRDLLAVFAAVFAAMLIVLLIVGGIATICFFISLVLLVLNLASPSRLSVGGAGAFGVMFLGSGIVFSTWMFVHAAQEPKDRGDAIGFGIAWLATHLLYAAALFASAVFGHRKRVRAGG